MAIQTTYSHQFMLEALQKGHDLENDILKMALMDTTFAFDPDTHATWGACSANEIAGGNGYVTGGENLTGVILSIDAVGNKVDIAATSITWTATAGDIPTTGSAVIYNSSHVNNTVVMCIDFDADYDTLSGKLFQIDLSNGLGEVSNAA